MDYDVYALYESLKTEVHAFKDSLSSLHYYFSSDHPVIYVATNDLKQYWFLQVEESTLSQDGTGSYGVAIKGRGVRVYLNAPVSPLTLLSDSYLMGENKPSSAGDFAHCCLSSALIRYEVFGHINASVTPSKISISDVIRNATGPDIDDYLLGELPHPNFVGNFAKYASWLLNGTSMTPNA